MVFIDQITLWNNSPDNQNILLKAAFVLLAVALQKFKYCILIYRTTPGREKIELVPSLFRGRIQSDFQENSQGEATLEMQVENARF